MRVETIMRLRLSRIAAGAYCEERLIFASVLHQARVKVRAAASPGTPAARPVMAGSDQRYLSDASATDCAWHDRSSRAIAAGDHPRGPRHRIYRPRPRDRGPALHRATTRCNAPV